MPLTAELTIEHNAPIPTWFGIGGRADRFARPRSIEELRHCLGLDPALRVLGDGANLLVDDDGVADLVVRLDAPAFKGSTFEPEGRVLAGAGADLPKLINECVRRGLGGVEGLAGIPATLGGAAIMNAGGAFGQVADAIARVHALDRVGGREIVLDRDEIDFAYRHSGLSRYVLISIELALHEEDAATLRSRLLEVMNYKKTSQPMADSSAGCVFRNPTLRHDLDGIAGCGERASAGKLIDLAGCKGMRVGGASVSQRHGNFIVIDKSGEARAGHVIELMQRVAAQVADRFGVTLEPEVVVWRRHESRLPG